MAAACIPQGVRGFNHHRGCFVVSGTYRLLHGGRQLNEKHCKEQSVVRANTVWKGLFELANENTRFEALYFQKEAKQFKVSLRLALAKPPHQNSFEVIKQLIQFIAHIDRVPNVSKDLLWEVGRSIGVFEFLRFDTH
jgi:hypothetical protein